MEVNVWVAIYYKIIALNFSLFNQKLKYDNFNYEDI